MRRYQVSTNNAAYSKFSPRDKLATARLAARTKYPYFSSALLNLLPKEAPGLGTLGVTEAMVLLWDPEAVDRWTLEHLVGVLVHEVGHVLRAHAQRAKALGIVSQEGRVLNNVLARVWNLAADCAINSDLKDAHPECFGKGCKECAAQKCTKGHGVLPSTFGLPDGLTAEAYYAELRQQLEKESEELEQLLQELGEQLEKEGEQGEGEGHGGSPLRGRCGSCAGNPVRGEEEGKGEGGNEGRSEVEVERVRKEVAEAVREVARHGRGSVPAGWERWAEATLQPPKVRWQDKLARTCRNAVAWKAGAVDLTHKRISRRQHGIGVGPGRPLVPALHAPVPQVAVVVDTSGSMGTEELTIALREVRGIMTGIGARVTFCACDAAVHELKQVSDWRELPKLLKGGGGTSFVPAFEALSKIRHGRANVTIFVTDGDGECPTEPPPGMRVLWLLTGSHAREPTTWGEMIRVAD
jgi:predicted metal-dependent peptidase